MILMVLWLIKVGTVTVIKEKFVAETEEMKDHCEEYWNTQQLEKASPDPATPESTRNANFQA